MIAQTLPKSASIVSTVSAPYGWVYTADELAVLIADMDSVKDNAHVSSFFCEVDPEDQKAFIKDFNVDHGKAVAVAKELSKLVGYTLPLAA